MRKVFTSDLEVITKLITHEQAPVYVFDPFNKLVHNSRFTFHLATDQCKVPGIVFIVSGNPQELHATFKVDFTGNTNGDSFYYFNNPDGTIRWIWPSTLKKPTFLAFYNSAYKNAVLLKKLMRVAFRARLTSFITSGKFCISGAETRLKGILDSVAHEHYSIFTGTTGPNRKALIELGDGNNSSHFVKVAIGENASALISNELSALEEMAKLQPVFIQVPASGDEPTSIALQKNIKDSGSASIANWTKLHTSALREIYATGISYRHIGYTNFYPEAEHRMNKARAYMREKGYLKHASLILNELEVLTNALKQEEHLIPVSRMHGDFTPWNMYVSTPFLQVYDWEMSKPQMPLLFDLFHFIIQKSVLVNHYNLAQIEQELDQALHQPEVKELINEFRIDVKLHLQLYLIHQISYYMEIYANQQAKHMQIEWLTRIWSEMLSVATLPYRKTNMRQDFVRYFFNEIKTEQYVTLKHIDKSFDDYFTFSDIDLLLRKDNLARFIGIISEAKGVSKITKVSKSFMVSLGVYFTDGSFISIDLIHCFMRKQLCYLSTEKLLQSSHITKQGVRIPDAEFAFEYTLLFSILNKANLPEKYSRYYSSLSTFEQVVIFSYIKEKYKLTHKNLNELFTYSPSLRKQLLTAINGNKQLHSISKLTNTVFYIVDTLKEMKNNKGIVITFSGVDGAGKSTILADVKQTLEKTFRKKVIVLRHRPSLLPILSSFQYGKKAAEERAATRLPRQGNNQSKTGSLLRFSYYYTDYLLGRFYLYIRYILTGHIVLFDRYYYDFIADPERSNIRLNSSLTNFLYKFVYKPSVNIFLYASPEVILSRKQELTYQDIESLTTKYTSLFKRLGSDKHISINNTDKQETIRLVLDAYIKSV